MAKLDMNLAFPHGYEGSKYAPRNYDIRITLNNAGKGKKKVIRFGLVNQAAKILGASQFIEPSNIEYTKDRIYFLPYEEKAYRTVHTLSSNSRTRQLNCYFSFTPTEKAEKMYRMNWINKTYELLYDEENELYYIEKTKEDKINA